MRYAMELIYSGVAIGAIYGLMAMAFAMTYKATGLLNFAQGELGMLIAYVAWSISVALGTSTWALIVGALVSSVLLGLMIEKFIMRKMIGQPVFSAVLVTVGLGVINSWIRTSFGSFPSATVWTMSASVMMPMGRLVSWPSRTTSAVAPACLIRYAAAATWSFWSTVVSGGRMTSPTVAG